MLIAVQVDGTEAYVIEQALIGSDVFVSQLVGARGRGPVLTSVVKTEVLTRDIGMSQGMSLRSYVPRRSFTLAGYFFSKPLGTSSRASSSARSVVHHPFAYGLTPGQFLDGSASRVSPPSSRPCTPRVSPTHLPSPQLLHPSSRVPYGWTPSATLVMPCEVVGGAGHVLRRGSGAGILIGAKGGRIQLEA
jgi:hypothetical protein